MIVVAHVKVKTKDFPGLLKRSRLRSEKMWIKFLEKAGNNRWDRAQCKHDSKDHYKTWQNDILSNTGLSGRNIC